VSRIRAAVLAAASTIALVVATRFPGVATGITAGCAVLATGAATWPSSVRGGKNSHHPHVITKKTIITFNW
jgi:hypothetical protein